MTDPTTIARQLTEAQREAMLARPSTHSVWGNPDLYCIVRRTGTVNALYGRGLIELGYSNTDFRLSELGLAVRTELERQSNEQ